MQRALGASEPPGLPMIKSQPSPSKVVPATTQKKETPKSPSEEDIPKPITPKNDLGNVAAAKETESPALAEQKKKASTTDATLPDKTAPSGETLKGQPGAPQQQSVTSAAKSAPSPEPEVGRPAPHKPPIAGTSPAKSTPPPAQPAKQESAGFFGFGGPKPQPTPAKSAESVTGKMFGFGSSFLSSASTLITSAVQDEPKTTPPTPRKMSSPGHVSPKITPPASPKPLPAKDTKLSAVQKPEEKKSEKPQQEKTPSAVQAKVDKADQSICPLCKVKLNMGSKDPPNYSTCTKCKTTVCNLCGFNPMPNVAEVNDWHYFALIYLTIISNWK